MIIVSKVYNKTKQLIQYSNKIKNKYKLYKLYKQSKETIKKVYQEKRASWQHIQDEFMNSWKDIKKGVRQEVHIPSLSQNEVQKSTMEKYI